MFLPLPSTSPPPPLPLPLPSPIPTFPFTTQLIKRQVQTSPFTTMRRGRRLRKPSGDTSIARVWTQDWTSEQGAYTVAPAVMVQGRTPLVSGCWVGTRPRPVEEPSPNDSPPSSPVTKVTSEREVTPLHFATTAITPVITTHGRPWEVESPSPAHHHHIWTSAVKLPLSKQPRWAFSLQCTS